MERVGIVGMGHVGSAMAGLFPDAVCYDAFLDEFSSSRRALDGLDVAFVCVPTPMSDSGAADVSIVEEVVGWLDAGIIVIRSTVPPGTTERLRESTGKAVVFCPEYYGEWAYPVPWERSPEGWPFMIFGGQPEHTRRLVSMFANRLGAEKRYVQTAATEAELCKYMENSWLALQVVFAEEFARISAAHDADYWEVRELWSLDPRVPATHTAVDPDDPGFGGKCLPKDLAAITESSAASGHEAELLRFVVDYNRRMREANDRTS